MSEAHSLLSPIPPTPIDPRSGRVIARILRENALLAFPPQAFEEDVVFRRFFGRQQVILNRPKAIHHILVRSHKITAGRAARSACCGRCSAMACC